MFHVKQFTQGKEDKEKHKQKNCCGAVGVRSPSAYNEEVITWQDKRVSVEDSVR